MFSCYRFLLFVGFYDFGDIVDVASGGVGVDLEGVGLGFGNLGDQIFQIISLFDRLLFLLGDHGFKLEVGFFGLFL